MILQNDFIMGCQMTLICPASQKMYTVWVTSNYAEIFPYHTPLSHSAFSMSKGTATMDTIDATHTHKICNSYQLGGQELWHKRTDPEGEARGRGLFTLP